MLATAADRPDPGCVEAMAAVDALPLAMRELVHEYGAAIVLAMWAEDFDDATELRELLEERRRRKQQEWLDTDYIQPKGIVAAKPARPVFNTRANGRKATFAEMMQRYQDAEKLMMNWKAAG